MVDLQEKGLSNGAIEAFEKNDVELSVPEGAPKPVLIIVMVSPLPSTTVCCRMLGRRTGRESSCACGAIELA